MKMPAFTRVSSCRGSGFVRLDVRSRQRQPPATHLARAVRLAVYGAEAGADAQGATLGIDDGVGDLIVQRMQRVRKDGFYWFGR